jgi:hypothetical protein
VAQFSLAFSKSTGVGRASDSTRRLWKLFGWRFLIRHRLSFRCLFLSPKGLGALMNPNVTFAICFIDDFPVDTDSVFVDFFCVNRGCERWRIHAWPVEAVSMTISESAANQFSLTISQSTGAVGADESKRHLWNRFRWWFGDDSDSVFINSF